MSPLRGLGISILLDYNNVTPTEFFIIGIILLYNYITTSGVRKFPILQTTIISALQGFDKTQQTSSTISLFVAQSFTKKYTQRYLTKKIENGESRLRGDTKKSPNAFDIWALIYVISLFENRDPRLRGDTNKAIFLLGNSVLPWLQ